MNSIAASLGFAARRSVVSFGGGLLSGGCMLQEKRAAPHEPAVTAKSAMSNESVFQSGALISSSDGGAADAFLALGASRSTAFASRSSAFASAGFASVAFASVGSAFGFA